MLVENLSKDTKWRRMENDDGWCRAHTPTTRQVSMLISIQSIAARAHEILGHNHTPGAASLFLDILEFKNELDFYFKHRVKEIG